MRDIAKLRKASGDVSNDYYYAPPAKATKEIAFGKFSASFIASDGPSLLAQVNLALSSTQPNEPSRYHIAHYNLQDKRLWQLRDYANKIGEALKTNASSFSGLISLVVFPTRS